MRTFIIRLITVTILVSVTFGLIFGQAGTCPNGYGNPINQKNCYKVVQNFAERVTFQTTIVQKGSALDSATLTTTAGNTVLGHGNGSLVVNNSKAIIGNVSSTGYKVSASDNNIQFQQGSTDSSTLTFLNDTLNINTTVAAYKVTPKLDANSVTGFWKTDGNAGTNPATDFIGTTDSKAFIVKSKNVQIARFDTLGNAAIGSAIAGFGAAAPIASGQNSFALGAGTVASGIVSFAGGINSTASGIASFSYGANTSASATGSFAFGNACDNSGTNSITLGEMLLNSNNSAAVFGQNNEDAANMIFGVGIGADTNNRANAITILNTGEVGIGITAPDATLHLSGTLKYDDGTQAIGKVLTSDANGLATWDYPFTTMQTTKSGDGVSNVVTIAHLLAYTPTFVSAVPTSDEARGLFKITQDATNVYLTYTAPLTLGTNNLSYSLLLTK